MDLHSYRVVESKPDSLLLRRSRLRAAVGFLAVSAFLCIWYGTLLGDEEIDLWRNPVIWLFLLAPLPIVYALLSFARITFLGEEFRFDITNREMLKNGNPLASFESIQELKMEAHHDEDGTSYGLHLVWKDGRKYSLVSDQRIEYATKLADDIAEITRAEVVGCESDRAKMFSEGGIHF